MNERNAAMIDNPAVRDPPPNGRPIRDIFQEMVKHISEIVHSEVTLISVEMEQKATQLKTPVITIAVGNVLIIYGGIFLLLSAVYALSMAWPAWLSALVVGAGIGIAGILVLATGIGKIKHLQLKQLK